VAHGQTITAVAAQGLLKSRKHETLRTWLDRYLEQGLAGLKIKSGRGRKAAFFPKSLKQAQNELLEFIHRSPQTFGLERSRWWLAGLREVAAWLKHLTLPAIQKRLHRLNITYKRGRAYVCIHPTRFTI
jgi:transposase